VHLALYLLFFAVPLSGWAYSSAAGFPIVWFGVLPLPDFVPVDKALAETLKGLHKVLTLSLAALVVAHVAAALKHQWVDRDGLLARMGVGRT
jgi:cytochrome b561